MNRTLTVIFALAAGLVGGMLPRYLMPIPVNAQTNAPKEIQAQSFVIVDGNNKVVGTFKSSAGRMGPAVVLLDQAGREIWRAGSSFRALTEK